ncbi:Cof-type HAD-IIB family hydrolase [Paenibacillus sp. LHD-117]|uniref:Cof-type HAD-IIB family hydrolase n=1 Tax=Paenibacillus sp. LHD-117 TaxID=3071412 RepID=UPI0027DF538F|nr:Cof-type HAD-IIB family hydrolase [Paenibacillus sp. LHD-117]MDQ6418398.1 Cof-type HAD-IIB family hydrolase [Paenibacillus sp. LHD-117]
MIKLIVSDLDGTLLDHGKRINERDLQSLAKAYDHGFDLCIASGRMNSEIQILLQPFANRFYAVGQNGATIHMHDQRLLASAEFTPELSTQLLQVTGRDEFIHFIHCNDDSFYVRDWNEAVLSYEARIMTAISTHADLEGAIAADHMRCSKLSYFGELEKLVQLEARFKHRFTGQIETFISDKDCLDVMPCNVSKGDALKLLIQELGIASDEIACIGDSFNDLSMFALTPHSFAMSESRDEIRSRASTVVQSVAEAIDHIIAYNYMSSTK